MVHNARRFIKRGWLGDLILLEEVPKNVMAVRIMSKWEQIEGEEKVFYEDDWGGYVAVIDLDTFLLSQVWEGSLLILGTAEIKKGSLPKPTQTESRHIYSSGDGISVGNTYTTYDWKDNNSGTYIRSNSFDPGTYGGTFKKLSREELLVLINGPDGGG